MRKRGPRPKGKVRIIWSPKLAYAIGLLVTDGCLYSDGRHISLVSKDKEQLVNFCRALGISVPIGKSRSASGKITSRVQFSDVLFYRFLLSIGLAPNKTKTIAKVQIPTQFFFDFLRGHFDGDGCTYSYFDPRWKSSFMFYTTFVSASQRHIAWLQDELFAKLQVHGHITKSKTGSVYQLKFAKNDSLKLLRKMYAGKNKLFLPRKRLKIEKMLSIVGESL